MAILAGRRFPKGFGWFGRFSGGAEPEPTEGVVERRVAQRSKRPFNLCDPRRIVFDLAFWRDRWWQRRSNTRGNVANPKDELPDLGRLQALAQRRHEPMPHHTQMMKPHGIRHMDDQATVPERMGFGMSGDLGSDDRRPDPPDLMLANPAFDAKALQRARQRVRDFDRMAPGPKGV